MNKQELTTLLEKLFQEGTISFTSVRAILASVTVANRHWDENDTRQFGTIVRESIALMDEEKKEKGE